MLGIVSFFIFYLNTITVSRNTGAAIDRVSVETGTGQTGKL